MEYAIIFLPLVGSIIGYLGKSLTKYFSEVYNKHFCNLFQQFYPFLYFGNGIQNNIMEIIRFLNGLVQEILLLNWSINIDPLSSVMLVVVTFVSALVHIYSIGYMSHDPHKPRFMSYLIAFYFFNASSCSFR